MASTWIYFIQTAMVIYLSLIKSSFSMWSLSSGVRQWWSASSACPNSQISIPEVDGDFQVRGTIDMPPGDKAWVGIYKRRQYVRYLGCAASSSIPEHLGTVILSASIDMFKDCFEGCLKSHPDTEVIGLMGQNNCHCYADVDEFTTGSCILPCGPYECGGQDSVSLYEKVNDLDVQAIDADDPGYCVSMRFENENVNFYNTDCTERRYPLCEIDKGDEIGLEFLERNIWSSARKVCSGKNSSYQLSQIDLSTVDEYDTNYMRSILSAREVWVATISYDVMETTNDTSSPISLKMECAYVERNTEGDGLILKFSDCDISTRRVLCDMGPETTVTTVLSSSTSEIHSITLGTTVSVPAIQTDEQPGTTVEHTNKEEGPDTVVTVVAAVVAVIILTTVILASIICYKKRCRNYEHKDTHKKNAVKPHDNLALDVLDEQAASGNSTYDVTGNYAYATVSGDSLPPKAKNDSEGQPQNTDTRKSEHTYDMYETANFSDVDNTYNRAGDHLRTGAEQNTATENIYNKADFNKNDDVYDHTTTHLKVGQLASSRKASDNAYGTLNMTDENVYDSTTQPMNNQSFRHVVSDNDYGMAAHSHQAN